MNEEEDSFLEQLMSDDSTLENLIQRFSETPTESSSSDHEEHHVIYVKRRKYEWKNGPTQQTVTISKRSRRTRGHFAIPIPRILKSDIRRKFVFMYENVMNSYDYHLISSYFQRFFVADVRFEKKDIFATPVKYVTILEGVQPVLCYFLLLLQMCPDKITRVSEIQLKQSSDDVDRTEVACKFNVKNTMFYQTNPLHYVQILQHDLREMCGRDNNFVETSQSEEELTSTTRRKRKIESVIINDREERHQSLFDPVSGVFLKSRFELIDRPVEYSVEGYMSFIVNKEKRIEKVIVTPTERVRLSCHETIGE